MGSWSRCDGEPLEGMCAFGPRDGEHIRREGPCRGNPGEALRTGPSRVKQSLGLAMGKCLHDTEESRQTRQCGHRGGDRSDAAKSQERPGAAGSWERQGTILPPSPRALGRTTVPLTP